MNLYQPNNFHTSQTKTPSVFGVAYLSRVVFLTFFSFVLLMTPSQASEPQIEIVDSWVEDGWGFYVAFEASPSNDSCLIIGEGLIEFQVTYWAPNNSSGVQSAFGLAIWPANSENETTVEARGKAHGSQAHCFDSSPCTIEDIMVVKTWCPISEEPIWPPWPL